jgi:hypothetical protein
MYVDYVRLKADQRLCIMNGIFIEAAVLRLIKSGGESTFKQPKLKQTYDFIGGASTQNSYANRLQILAGRQFAPQSSPLHNKVVEREACKV